MTKPDSSFVLVGTHTKDRSGRWTFTKCADSKETTMTKPDMTALIASVKEISQSLPNEEALDMIVDIRDEAAKLMMACEEEIDRLVALDVERRDCVVKVATIKESR